MYVDGTPVKIKLTELTPRFVPPTAVVMPVHPKAISSAAMHSSSTPRGPKPPETSP